MADAVLTRLSLTFGRICARVGQASLLIALCSVRSERAFCAKSEYSLPWRWFLDMDLLEHSFDATVFTKIRQRLLTHDVGRNLFDEVVWTGS